MSEISKEEARKRLEDSVKKVDWITHFLGNKSDQNFFLECYRDFYTQLREGDNLDIKVHVYREPGENSPTAEFLIVLNTASKKKKTVCYQSVSSRTIAPKLYKD